MAWFSFLQRFVKETFSTGFIWRVMLKNWPVWHIFMQCRSPIPFIIILFFLVFIVCNVARFVTSGYPDKKFIVFCHASLPIKNDWEHVLSVVGDYSQFFPPSFFPPFYSFQCPQPQLKFRGDLRHGAKKISGRSILHMISSVLIWTHLLLSKDKNILRSWFIDWYNMLKYLVIPRNHKMFTCFHYLWLWTNCLLDNCLIFLAWYQHPYNQYYYSFVCINPW